MSKSTISIASENEISELVKPVIKIDYGSILVESAPMFAKNILSESERAVRQIEEEYQRYQFSKDEKTLIAQNAINLARTTHMTFNNALWKCVMDAVFGENRVRI